jgi:hypothetical protein
MKYWHPHLPFGQHISVSTLVYLTIKKNERNIIIIIDWIIKGSAFLNIKRWYSIGLLD